MSLIDSAITVKHRFAEQAAVAETPAAGTAYIYVKTDGRLYVKNDAGVESQTGGALGVAQITPTELTIASGAITVTQGFHKIDTQGNAGTDDLDTINGLVANAFYLFKPEDLARVVKFKHGTGNIISRTISDTVMTDTGIFGWSDGTNFYPITPSSPNDVDPWGGVPDADVNIPAQDTTGELYSINGIYFALWQTYQLSSGMSFDAIPNMHLIFDSATAFQAQINDSTTAAGMAWEIQVLTAPGAGNHTLRLGAGCTFDGVNNTASFNATSDLLEGKWISATRFLIKTNTSVTLSST